MRGREGEAHPTALDVRQRAGEVDAGPVHEQRADGKGAIGHAQVRIARIRNDLHAYRLILLVLASVNTMPFQRRWINYKLAPKGSKWKETLHFLRWCRSVNTKGFSLLGRYVVARPCPVPHLYRRGTQGCRKSRR